MTEYGANNPEIKKILDEIAKVKEQLKDAEDNEDVEDYYKEGLRDRLKDLEEALDILSKNLPAVNEVPEYPLPQSGNTSTGTQASSAQAQEAPTANTPAGINPRTSANSAQTATNETPAEEPAVAAPVAEAPESEKQELPNTGSAEFAVFTPAVLSILAGLGLVAPKGKKEDK